jgi:hypothetical protein
MPKWARAASQAHRRATKKKRAELRQRRLPMIGRKNGKVRESSGVISRLVTGHMPFVTSCSALQIGLEQKAREFVEKSPSFASRKIDILG